MEIMPHHWYNSELNVLQSAAYSEPISTNSIPIDAYFKSEFNGSIFIAIEQKLTKLFYNHWGGHQNLSHLDRTLHKLYLCVNDSATKLIPIDAHFQCQSNGSIFITNE